MNSTERGLNLRRSERSITFQKHLEDEHERMEYKNNIQSWLTAHVSAWTCAEVETTECPITSSTSRPGVGACREGNCRTECMSNLSIRVCRRQLTGDSRESIWVNLRVDQSRALILTHTSAHVQPQHIIWHSEQKSTITSKRISSVNTFLLSGKGRKNDSWIMAV